MTQLSQVFTFSLLVPEELGSDEECLLSIGDESRKVWHGTWNKGLIPFLLLFYLNGTAPKRYTLAPSSVRHGKYIIRAHNTLLSMRLGFRVCDFRVCDFRVGDFDVCDFRVSDFCVFNFRVCDFCVCDFRVGDLDVCGFRVSRLPCVQFSCLRFSCL